MPLALIFNANSPTQSADGSLESFDSQGNTQDQDFVRGDISLGLSLRPVVPSVTSARPWDDDHISTDTYQVGIGNPDVAPTGGDFPLGIFAGTIATSSVAASTVITTSADHNLVTGDTVIIAGHAGSTPSINGTHIATVTSATTFTIPVNVSVGGTGGIAYDAEGMENIAFDQTAASLQTIISALSVKHAFPAVVVELMAAGIYQFTWATSGAVPSLYSPTTNDLTPDSAVSILVDSAGDADTQAIQILAAKQQPVAFAQPATEFPIAAVTATISQAGSATANKIYSTSFTPGIYGGTFSTALTLPGATIAITSSSVANPTVITTEAAHGLTTGDSVWIEGHGGSTPSINGTHVATVTGATTFTIPVNVSVGGTLGTVQKLVTETVGVATPSISADDYLALLSTHSLADATNLDDFEVTIENQIITVEFKGNFILTNSPIIAVTNIDLLAPKGVSGLISLNTTSLFRAFALTEETTLDFTLAIRRLRASGEQAEIFQHTVTLKRSLIDALTLVPVSLPTYYTAAQSDARFAKIEVLGIRELPDTGEIIVYSPDDTAWSITVDDDGLVNATPV
ncbi:MAG: hypothetical protein WC069_06155 [Candidatus Shapirobacteria bacterium]